MRARLHRLTDDALSVLVRGVKLYADGFGDTTRLERMVEVVRDYERPRELGLSVRWDGPGRVVAGILHRRGSYLSPTASELPQESRRGSVELLVKADVAPSQRPPLCVMLAATGEEGFLRRYVFARALVLRGIAALFVENPFYGSRRPRGQTGPALRTVAEQFAMNVAMVDEARGLLAWLAADGYETVGVTGYSQGGMMAAFAAALTPWPVVAVPRGAGSSAVPIFTESALSRAMHWDKLAAEAGGLDAAKRYFARCLEPVDVRRFSPPAAPELAIIVAASHDGFVKPEEAESLHAHWPGSELRWDDAGHVTAAVFEQRAHRRAVRDAFRRAADRRRR